MKQMFEKVANEQWSGRKVYHWLRFDMNFRSATSNKPLTLSNIYRLLQTPFFYGVFEYPAGSGNWYTGKHQPLITRELFEKTKAQLKRSDIKHEDKQFAFSRLMTCGLCGSGIVADEKWKKLAKGGMAHYIYYGCNRSRNLKCKCGYLREEALIAQLIERIGELRMDESIIKKKFDDEYARMRKFQRAFLGVNAAKTEDNEFEPRQYATHILKEGTVEEKRELLAALQSKIVLRNKKISLE